MHYQKPVVMDLGSRARRATGNHPLACISGAAAGGILESCGTGTGAHWSCVGGSAVDYSYLLCVGGSAAIPFGNCFSGTGVDIYCGAGSGRTSDPYGCQTGPVP